MKNFFLIFLLSLALCVGIKIPALAAPDPEPNIVIQIGQDSYGAADASTLSQTVGKVIRIILGLLGIIFLGLTVYAGALWMTAAGDEEKVTKAIGIIRMAVIGLIVILASYSLSYFVLDKIFEATL